MKKTYFRLSFVFLVAAIFTAVPFAHAVDGPAAQAPTPPAAAAPEVAPAPAPAAPPPVPAAPAPKAVLSKPTIQIDKTEIANGGVITVTGTAPAGKPVFLEVWAAEKTVRSNFFDSKKDEKTGEIPYKLYLTNELPAYYKTFVPKDMQGKIDDAKKAGKGWKYSEVLKGMGADAAYSVPAKVKIDAYQANIMASILGSRGDLLPPLDEKENKRRSMQLVKSKFRDVDKLIGADVEVSPDGTYKAQIKIRGGLAPGKYNIVAYAVDKKKEGDKETVEKVKSDAEVFTNNIGFPNVYLANAGASINAFIPFLLTLVIAIFGVLMGAGGGFILNPILVMLFPIPHTVVAGTVMPTVLFSQATGIMNYSKIKFINWKLGIGIGCAMLVGGFIGPKLTELITLDQFKSLFGWVLFVLAGLMFWQTTPGYLEKNKKESAILKEFKKRAEAAAKG